MTKLDLCVMEWWLKGRSPTWGASRLMETKADRYMGKEVKEQERRKKDFLGCNCTTPPICGRKIFKKKKKKYWFGRLQADGRTPIISLQTSLSVKNSDGIFGDFLGVTGIIVRHRPKRLEIGQRGWMRRKQMQRYRTWWFSHEAICWEDEMEY